MRLLWLLASAVRHACADPELVAMAIKRMEARGQHDTVAQVRAQLAANIEDDFDRHYVAAVRLQLQAEAAERAAEAAARAPPPGADAGTAALMAQIRGDEARKQGRVPDAGDILAKIRAFEAAKNKPKNDLAALAAQLAAEKARGGGGNVAVNADAAALMAKIRADDGAGDDGAAALMASIRAQEATLPDTAALMADATPAAAKLVESLQAPPAEEESATEKARKSGDVEALKRAIRGDEVMAKKQARKRKEGLPKKGARAAISFSLERRADSVEEAGAPVVITWISTRKDKKEGQVAVLDGAAPAVAFKALVGARFRARAASGQPIVDFEVAFLRENFTVPAPPGTKLYKETPALPADVAKSEASVEAGRALEAFERKSRLSPPAMANATDPPPQACDTAGLNAKFLGTTTARDGHVLVVLRGEVFRGLHHGIEVLDERVAMTTATLRRGLVCAPHSFILQRAVARAQLARIVAPLEERGIAVDIIIASPGCTGAPVSEKVKARWWVELQQWYGPRLREAVLCAVRVPSHAVDAMFPPRELDGAEGDRPNHFVRGGVARPILTRQIPRRLDGTLGHKAHLIAAVDLALRMTARDIYRSVLIWRIDVAPLAPLVAPPKKFGEAPTDYLDSDNDEIAGVGHGHAWAFPAAVLGCFRAVLDDCWVVGSTGTWAHSCAAHAARASGLPLRRAPWCYLEPNAARPWFTSATVEKAEGASQLAKWQRAHNFNVSEGLDRVRAWSWLCPRPAAPVSLKDDVDKAFCDHLEEVDEDLDCAGADEADAEFCARLLTPALRPALMDDHVRVQFRCGGAARRGEL